MVNDDTYVTVTRFVLANQPSLPAGWTKGKPHRNAVAYDFVCSRWMDSLAIAAPGAKPLRFQVQGSDLMLFGEQTKISGSYVVKIDDREPRNTPQCAPTETCASCRSSPRARSRSGTHHRDFTRPHRGTGTPTGKPLRRRREGVGEAARLISPATPAGCIRSDGERRGRRRSRCQSRTAHRWTPAWPAGPP